MFQSLSKHLYDYCLSRTEGGIPVPDNDHIHRNTVKKARKYHQYPHALEGKMADSSQEKHPRERI